MNLTDAPWCSCNHAPSQHDDSGPCNECLCPQWTLDRSFVPAMVNDRWPLLLPPHRAYRTALPWFESARLASMWHYLIDYGFVDDQVVYDIGSEEGDFPALWASWGCDVVLVEPNPKAWPWIKQIFEANSLEDRVRGWFVGMLGQEEGTVSARRDGPGPWPPEASDPDPVAAHGFHHLAEHAGVDSVITLDMLSAWQPPPTAITIDVEGAEWQVLQGAEQTITDHHPEVWVSIHEQFARDLYGIEHVTDQIREWFQDRGYREHYLATDHEAHWMFLP